MIITTSVQKKKNKNQKSNRKIEKTEPKKRLTENIFKKKSIWLTEPEKSIFGSVMVGGFERRLIESKFNIFRKIKHKK